MLIPFLHSSPRCAAPAAILLLSLVVAGCQSGSDAAGASGVSVVATQGVVQVHLAGQPFTEYRYQEVSRPFLFPILGPDGEHFTRRWPQEDPGNEERDHPHHRGLWWAHGDANGVDFWSESKTAGRTVHVSFEALKSGRNEGWIISSNRWVAADGRVIATDRRSLRFPAPSGPDRIVDFEITVFASVGDLVLGDTKEGTMAIRLAETMRVTQPKGLPGEGHIFNAEGQRDGATWGRRAAWCDYDGPVNGRTVGVAIFDHPSNPRFPTWWHVRDYGLFAANPFGVHDFEKQEKGAGDLRVPAGGQVTFRYRFLFHPGDTSAAGVAAQFERWKSTDGR
ncbi:MAG: PmoA family protein [Verrucomicrobia bacterium]|nr:PmoA family protein [Verrucomicrobiota bacterium]